LMYKAQSSGIYAWKFKLMEMLKSL